MTAVIEERFTCDCGGTLSKCANCWEVEGRLKSYLRHERGRQFVAKALEEERKGRMTGLMNLGEISKFPDLAEGSQIVGCVVPLVAPLPSEMYMYRWPRPKVCVDAVVFSVLPVPSLLLILRGADPEKGKWALPGGHMEIDETTLDAAARELAEETGLSIHSSRFQQVGTFDRVDRHPGDRAISVAYTAEVVDRRQFPVEGRDDAKRAEWFSLSCLPEVAFDHLEIIRKAAYVWFGATKVVP